MRPALAPYLSCKICVFAVPIFPRQYWSEPKEAPVCLIAGPRDTEKTTEEGEGPVVVCLVGDKRKSGQGEAFARAIGIAGGTVEPTEDTKGLLAGVGLVDVVYSSPSSTEVPKECLYFSLL